MARKEVICYCIRGDQAFLAGVATLPVAVLARLRHLENAPGHRINCFNYSNQGPYSTNPHLIDISDILSRYTQAQKMVFADVQILTLYFRERMRINVGTGITITTNEVISVVLPIRWPPLKEN